MQERKAIELDIWLKNRKAALKNTPIELRPKK